MVLRVTGMVLPEREERTLFIDGGVLREEPVPGADSVGDGGWATLPAIARAAYEAGVTVLAGTDTHPCGTVAEEVERLISAGLPRAAALGTACWTARAWLGLPGLADGAPADLIVFAEDPVAHPDVLHHPSRIILRGQVLARAAIRAGLGMDG
jgi:imidazolonepropionase-like amidohydrolase